MSSSRTKPTDKTKVHQHGYRVMKVQFLSPGDYVFHTPRDKQVVDKDVKMKAGVTIIWRDLSRTVYPVNALILASPRLKTPHLALAPHTRQDRFTGYVDNVVIPTIEAARQHHGNLQHYGNLPPRDMAVAIDGVVTVYTFERDDWDWDRVVDVMHRDRFWSPMLHQAQSIMRINGLGVGNPGTQRDIVDRMRQIGGMESDLNRLDILTSDCTRPFQSGGFVSPKLGELRVKLKSRNERDRLRPNQTTIKTQMGKINPTIAAGAALVGVRRAMAEKGIIIPIVEDDND